MGTRGLIGMYKDEVTKATYNHFDSYPTALGNKIKEFIQKHSFEEMEEIFDKIKLVKKDSKPTEKQIKKCVEMRLYKGSVSSGKKEDWYNLLRHAQGELSIYGKVGLMVDNLEFIKDSLFCEYAYIINLTTKKLEIYKGFQTKADTKNNRYRSETPTNGEYYPCKLLGLFNFEKLPDMEVIEMIENE